MAGILAFLGLPSKLTGPENSPSSGHLPRVARAYFVHPPEPSQEVRSSVPFWTRKSTREAVVPVAISSLRVVVKKICPA
jgi:hypothetical protein